MNLMRFIQVAIASLIFSSTALAHQKICFGTAENKGNRLTLEINENQVHVLAADSRAVDIRIGTRVDHIAGNVYPFTKILNGTHRYDMGTEFAGSTLLLVDSQLVDETASTGSATIRSAGDNGLLYIRFFCRNAR